MTVDVDTAELFQEYQYHKAFGGAPAYDDQLAHKTDWFLAFEAMEEEVRASAQDSAQRRARLTS